MTKKNHRITQRYLKKLNKTDDPVDRLLLNAKYIKKIGRK